MLVPASFTEAAVLADGRVLVPGGNHGHYLGATLPIAEIFDPRTGTWTATGPMVAPHAKHTVTALLDGRVLVVGGEGRVGGVNGNPVTTSEIFDPATGRWTATGTALPEVTYNHSATRLRDGRVLVAGGAYDGVAGSGATAAAQVFDPATDSWAVVAPMSVARTYHSSLLLDDGRVLVAGGHDGSGVPQASAEIWDPVRGTWRPTAPMAFAHHSETNAAARLPGGRVLVVAGATVRSDGSRDVTDATQIFHPASGRWRPGPALPGPARTDHVVVALGDGRVLVAGGIALDPLLGPPLSIGLDDAYVLDGHARRWSVARSMHVPRHNAAATLLPDGSVLVAGGQHGVRDGAQFVDPRAERFVIDDVRGPRRP